MAAAELVGVPSQFPCHAVAGADVGRARYRGDGQCAGELAAMLAANIRALVAELLPAGRPEGSEWKVGSVAGEPGRSLSVRLAGPKAGVWMDFADGNDGDALDLVAQVLVRGDKRQAVRWARWWLGLTEHDCRVAVVPGRRPPPSQRTAAKATAAEAAGKLRSARRIFLEADVSLAGTGVPHPDVWTMGCVMRRA